MAVFSSLNVALSGLRTQLARVQTISHNISNAGTEGYSRQTVEVEAGAPHNQARFQIGSGAVVKSIRRVVDASLERRIHSAVSDQGKYSLLADIGLQLEGIVNPLEDNNLQSRMTDFFDALNALVATPTDSGLRALAVQQAVTLSETFRDMSSQITRLRSSLNDELKNLVADVNRITEEVAQLNVEVVAAEGGGVDRGSANDLRDRRDLLIRELSELIDIKTIETADGSMNVLSNGAYIVYAGSSFDITTSDESDGGAIISRLVVNEDTGLFQPSSGRIGGLIFARDNLLNTTRKDLNNLANSFIREFNRIHAEGRGTTPLREVVGDARLADTGFALSITGAVTRESNANYIISSDLAGLPDLRNREVMILSGKNVLERRTITGFDSTTGTVVLDRELDNPLSVGDAFQISELSLPVRNGSFEIIVENNANSTTQTFKISVDLNKSVAGSSITDTTLVSLASAVTQATSSAVVASVTNDGSIKFESSSSIYSFRFANDTSGALAALGVNSFFTGVDAADIAVRDKIVDDASLFATASTTSALDSNNLQRMVSLRTEDTVNGRSNFEEFFAEIGQVAASISAKVQDKSAAAELAAEQLENQRARISGVNIDEEAVKLLEAQQAFVASSRLIGVVDQMIQALLGAV